MENSHINESILSEEILEDQKKNRIDHMTYLPGMEDIGSDVMDQVVEAGDYKVLPVSVKDVDMNALRTLGDDLKGKIGSGVVILASDMGGKVNLIVTATDDAVKAGAHAGKIIKEAAALVGGGGGGRPNMAQAGGKNPAGIKAALEKAVEIAKEQL